MRPGDRLSLQLSDSNALLFGLGASKRFASVEVLGEVTWDIHVGSKAPDALDSPLRVGIGGRYHLTEQWQLALGSEIGLSGRPVVGPAEPFVPIEPRFAVLAGVRWVLPFGAPPKAAAPPTDGPAASGVSPVPAPSTASVTGRLVAEGGSRSRTPA